MCQSVIESDTVTGTAVILR